MRARASGGVFARSIAVAPWGLRLPGTIQLAVHAVIQGHAHLWTDGDENVLELKPGDLALVRGGPDHFIAHEPGARCVLPEDFRTQHSADEASKDGRAAVFLCGAYRFAGDIGAGLVGALPPVFSIPSRLDNPIHGVVALLSANLNMSNLVGRLSSIDCWTFSWCSDFERVWKAVQPHPHGFGPPRIHGFRVPYRRYMQTQPSRGLLRNWQGSATCPARISRVYFKTLLARPR